MVAERGVQRQVVGQVGLDEFGSRGDGATMAGDQGIVDGDFVPGRQELGGGDRADIAGAACDEDLHVNPPPASARRLPLGPSPLAAGSSSTLSGASEAARRLTAPPSNWIVMISSSRSSCDSRTGASPKAACATRMPGRKRGSGGR